MLAQYIFFSTEIFYKCTTLYLLGGIFRISNETLGVAYFNIIRVFVMLEFRREILKRDIVSL